VTGTALSLLRKGCAHPLQVGDFEINFGKLLRGKGFDLTHIILDTATDIQQLLHLCQRKAEILGTPDKTQTGFRLSIVQTIVGPGPLHRLDESNPLVIAQSLRSEPGFTRQTTNSHWGLHIYVHPLK
jgi:hypothetical protein